MIIRELAGQPFKRVAAEQRGSTYRVWASAGDSQSGRSFVDPRTRSHDVVEAEVPYGSERLPVSDLPE